jgi:hypothetical protein
MGPPEKQPPMVNIEWMQRPEGHRWVSKSYERANWLQAMEGGIDTSHSSFLHSRAHNVAITSGEYRARARSPRLEVLETPYGFTYAGVRHLADEGKSYVRAYQFVMPFHQMRSEAGGREHAMLDGHMWVPIDDEHTWVFNWTARRDGGPISQEQWDRAEQNRGRGPGNMLPGYFLKANMENDYFIDRALQKSGENYSGIPGVNTQDMAVQESMGPIYDRTKEHLGTSDLAIITARRLMLKSIQEVQEGRDPIGPFADASRVRPAEMVIPDTITWQDAMKGELVTQV